MPLWFDTKKEEKELKSEAGEGRPQIELTLGGVEGTGRGHRPSMGVC